MIVLGFVVVALYSLLFGVHAATDVRYECFLSQSALQAAVATYVQEVQPLPTVRKRKQHPLSKRYGYPIGVWCTQYVRIFSKVFFNQTTFNEKLTNWSTINADRMDAMFQGASRFNQDLSHFVTSKVRRMDHMFQDATQFQGKGLRMWDTSRVQNGLSMFQMAAAFNANIGMWKTSRMRLMTSMFQGATSFRQDLSEWDVRSAINTRNMFQGAVSFNWSLCAWGFGITNQTARRGMFGNTSCPEWSDPAFQPNMTGPFCHMCRATLPSATTGLITLPLIPSAATQLPNGMLLTWAANSNVGTKKNPQWATFMTMFDPESRNATTMVVHETNHGMFCPGTAMLGNGELLVTGGKNGPQTSIYNPLNQTWRSAGTLNVVRGYNTQLLLSNGDAFTIGGSWSGPIGGKFGEVFSHETETWTAKPGIYPTGDLLTNDIEGVYRSDNHIWLFEATNGKMLQAGPSQRMHWLELAGNGSVTATVLRGDDTDAMNGGAVMFDIEKIFTVGGSKDYNVSSYRASNRAYIIDISGPEPVVERQPDLSESRVFLNVVVLPNGMIVLLGGQSRALLFSNDYSIRAIEMFDPITKSYSLFRLPLSAPRSYHSIGVLLKDGRIASGGGGGKGVCCIFNNSYDHPDLEIITPPYLLNEDGSSAARPSIQSAASTFAVGSTVDVTMDTLGPHTFALMRLGSWTHSINLDQRRVPLTTVTQADATWTLQIPASSVHVPPGWYWLFAMNEAGVPSVGHTMLRDF